MNKNEWRNCNWHTASSTPGHHHKLHTTPHPQHSDHHHHTPSPPPPPPPASVRLTCLRGCRVLPHWATLGPRIKFGFRLPSSSSSSWAGLYCHTWSKPTSFCTYSLFVCLLVGCLTSQQQASVSQGRICSDNFTCCHTEIEVADPTFYLTQSQYTDTRPTSPSADPITPGAWQGSHWSANF